MKRSRDEVATYIEHFLTGNDGTWDWDDFTSTRIDDAELDRIRTLCVKLHDQYPSRTGYCNDDGLEILRGIVRELRKP